uniref:Uncharacterized protein n=1 Tax=Cacopsylla melanoneura TaxID=428564 RepID=A0A8D8UBM7_9HEMI
MMCCFSESALLEFTSVDGELNVEPSSLISPSSALVTRFSVRRSRQTDKVASILLNRPIFVSAVFKRVLKTDLITTSRIIETPSPSCIVTTLEGSNRELCTRSNG